jgi:purine-nucleoside phosphorylase
MLIEDYIGFVGMAGHNPLIGPNDPLLGTRFPDMTTAYDLDLRKLALRVAEHEQITLRTGVYAHVAGPTFETPAEVRALRLLGGDAVGMSTAPETVVARHAGMRVMGVSGISNMAHDSSDPTRTTTHAEVMEIGETKIVPSLTRLLRGVVRDLDI